MVCNQSLETQITMLQCTKLLVDEQNEILFCFVFVHQHGRDDVTVKTTCKSRETLTTAFADLQKSVRKSLEYACCQMIKSKAWFI